MQIYSIEITFVHYPNQIIIMHIYYTIGLKPYHYILHKRITQCNRLSIHIQNVSVWYRWYYVDTDDCIKEEIIVLIWIYVCNAIIQ